jgi:hypothetical protein
MPPRGGGHGGHGRAGGGHRAGHVGGHIGGGGYRGGYHGAHIGGAFGRRGIGGIGYQRTTRRHRGGGGSGGVVFSVPEILTPEQAAYRDACDVYDDQFELPAWCAYLSAFARFVLFVALPLTGASIGTAWYKIFIADAGSSTESTVVARLVGTADNYDCARYYFYDSAFSSCWGGSLYEISNSASFGESSVVTTRGLTYIIIAALVMINDVVLILRALCSCCCASAAPSQFGVRAAFIDTVQAGIGAVALIAAGANFSSSAVTAALNSKFDCAACTSTSSDTPGYQLSIAACALYLTGAALLAIRCVHLMNLHAAWTRSPGAQAAEPVLTNVPAITPLQMSAMKVAQFLLGAGQMDFALEKTEQMYAEAGNPPESAEPDPLDLLAVALKKWAQPVPFRADIPPNSTLVPMCFQLGDARKRLLVVVDPSQAATLDGAAAAAYAGAPGMMYYAPQAMMPPFYPPPGGPSAPEIAPPPLYGHTAVNADEPQQPSPEVNEKGAP